MRSAQPRAPMWLVLLVSGAMALFLAAGADSKRDRALWGMLAVACVVLAGRSVVNFFRTGD